MDEGVWETDSILLGTMKNAKLESICMNAGAMLKIYLANIISQLEDLFSP
jgi:hypothetical protein